MSRVQLALNVSNIDEAVAFYSMLFGTERALSWARPGDPDRHPARLDFRHFARSAQSFLDARGWISLFQAGLEVLEW